MNFIRCKIKSNEPDIKLRANLTLSVEIFNFLNLTFMKILSMLKIEHIGIAVRDLSLSVPLFEKLLNCPCYKTETVETEKVKTAFFQQGETKIELLESTEPNGIIGKFISKKGEAIHHLAFAVADIEAEMKRLVEAGFELLDSQPRTGADNKWVCFLHPKNTNGILIELCMEKNKVP
jgi:methylmalonyl-CoA/ethylmalonyl-CoA epimerase